MESNTEFSLHFLYLYKVGLAKNDYAASDTAMSRNVYSGLLAARFGLMGTP